VTGSKASRDLRDLLSRLRSLRASGLAKVSKALAVAAKGLILDGFEGGKDPYGQAWAEVERAGIPLNDTGALRTSWFIAGATAQGFVISTNSPYAQYHQGGTKRLKVRMMIPRSGALPKAWDREFTAVATAKLKGLLKK
jgi:phage gpG-like protein